jgi:DNA polymerase elongation subunit (family B)
MSRPLNELDLECYPDYFLAKFYDERTKRFHSFGMWPGQPLDIAGLVNLLSQVTVVTFNGNKYDILMLTLALYNATNAQLKEANDDIIVRKMGNTPWVFLEKWGIQIPDYIDTIDIMDVAPGVRIGLKMYMGRLHAPTLQDLPYDPDTALDGAGRFVIADYCGNDLIGTNLLRHEVWERVQLRIAIGQRYGVDVRSKSDAQIAEAVIKSQLDFYPQKRYVPHGYSFNYEPPAYIEYVTPQMKELLQVVRTAPFVVTDKEEALMLYGEATGIRTGVNIPKELYGRDIIIGEGVYRLGIGGLHSQESSASYFSDQHCKLRDIDVKSYYPSLILTMGMVPEQLGPAFLIIFRAIYERRLLTKSESARIADLWEAMGSPELKAEADLLRTESDGLKIVLNGTFGKLFSKYSILYAPELGIRVTITGQLALLMLIEMMECSGINVLSANTDGIVLRIPTGMESIADQIVKWWEARTGLEMEATEYRSIHQRDVNNYIAIDTKGKAKRKGVFNNGGVLSGPQGKGPNMDICADAVVAWLKDGTPICNTIRECTDIRKFIVLRGVTGGGSYVRARNDGGYESPQYLGKAVRWYYHTWRSSYIADAKGGRVAGSLGAMPLMKLPDVFPPDIDYAKYVAEAMEMVADIGLPVRYWHHAESDSYFIDHEREDYFEQGCDEIDKKTYDKRK